ncbi:MAG: XRE family transcriptional regulator [Chloroflexota bacterium]|nr:XRE family transcriptional regulator [Chloroflexota bacterium]
MTAQRPTHRPTLVEKIDRLFKTIHPHGRGEYTYEEASTGIAARGIATMSDTYLWELRTGRKDNPRKKHMEALADFFGVASAYFLDDNEAAALIYAEIAHLQLYRDADVQGIAVRTVGLSAAALAAITAVVAYARRIEGLNDEEG